MTAAADDHAWLRRQGLGSVREVLDYAAPDVAAISRSSDIARVDLPPECGGPRCVFVKRYVYPGWPGRLKQLLPGALVGTGRARFEYEFLGEMRRRGVPAVRPIAFGEDRLFGFVRATFLITEGEPDAASLDTTIKTTAALSSAPVDRKRRLIAELGGVIRRMHDAGVRHGGLYWRNILVREIPETGDWRVQFLDPDRRARLHDGAVPRDDAVADLAEFAASALALDVRGGLSRLMRAYRDTPRLSASDRSFMRTVVARARTLERAERHRVVVGDLIARLRKRVAERAQTPAGDTVPTLSAFFDRIAARKPPGAPVRGHRRIVFDLGDPNRADEHCVRTLTLCDDGYRVSDGRAECPDLTIKTDSDVWLAIVNARTNAFDMVRSRGFHISGDIGLLAGVLNETGI